MSGLGADDRSPAALSKRHVIAAVLGIALEVYDFTVYSYFAVAITQAFFPASQPLVGLMLSLGTFGIGFLSRPVGAVVIGRYADRAGRAPAMVLSFVMMGVGVLILAIMPTYARIGIWAPVGVLVARLIQGFALGGEVGATTAFLLEAGPERQRGLYCSMQNAGQGQAAVAAAIVGVTLSSCLDPIALQAYGWRIAMLLGAVVLPIGLSMRRRLPETLHLPEGSAASTHEPNSSSGTARIAVLGLLVIGSAAAGNQILHYMSTYAMTILHFNARVALAVPGVTGFCVMTCGVLGGFLSDRYGRRPIMIWPTVLGLAATYPVFYYILSSRSVFMLLGGLGLLALLGALAAGAALAAITESLPRRVRSTTFSLVYAGSLALFAGSAQFVVTWLMHLTGNPMAPAWYICFTGLLGLVARTLLKESAPGRIATPGEAASAPAGVTPSNSISSRG